MDNGITRRDALKAVGGASVAAAFGARALDLLGAEAQAASTCLLTPEVTEGPYWVDGALTRRNITEGKRGMPLVIRFTVLDARSCAVIPGADVEIWHCDANGVYSGVNGATTRFLRGHQRADARGRAELVTIFPGWYPGRTPHIHMKVHVGGTHRAHRAGVLQRGDHAEGLRTGSLRAARRLRHPARARHDLRPGRRLHR